LQFFFIPADETAGYSVRKKNPMFGEAPEHGAQNQNAKQE
jgi:hypothetical protein